MKLRDFFKDNLMWFGNFLLGLFFLLIFLPPLEISKEEIFILATFYSIFFLAFFIISYLAKNRELKNISNSFEKLEEKYLLSEVMKRPASLEGRFYYDVLRSSQKSMLDEISKIENEKSDYEDYIEQWVHEIKTPISAISLMAENNKSPVTNRILLENMKIDFLVEQALYYSRSQNVEKDFILKAYNISNIVKAVLLKNRRFLAENGLAIEFVPIDFKVLTDEKWISFILNQFISNSIKYKNENDPRILISLSQEADGLHLSFEDNGIGIEESDLARIFDKGFTGKRNISSSSTGIGLYLSKKIADELNLKILMTSIQNSYSKVTLVFPNSSLVK